MGSQWDVPFWFTLQPLVGQPHVQALCQAPDTHRDAQKTKGSNFPGDPAIRTPCSHSKGAWVQSLMVNPTCLIELPKKKKKKKSKGKGWIWPADTLPQRALGPLPVSWGRNRGGPESHPRSQSLCRVPGVPSPKPASSRRPSNQNVN